MEVKLAWLEPVSDEGTAHAPEAEAIEPPRSSRRKPPRLPGAKITLPPMPLAPDGPTPHRTMEVEMSWLEVVDERPSGTKRSSTRPVPVEEAIRPRKKPSKPIPRED